MKKLLALFLCLAMVLSLAACAGSTKKETKEEPAADSQLGSEAGMSIEDVKVGFIFLHDENSTYDKNFIDAAKAATEAMGLSDDQVVFKTNIPEGAECYDAAAELADDGCDLIFADSFGHEDFLIEAALEFPDVIFCHATGTKAHTEGLDNFYNAFATIYEGRYLVGVAAGLKLNEMIAEGKITEEQAKMGYVGAYPYAEVISGYTSFYLGAKSVCPSVTMSVKYTNSWFDIAMEKEAANALIADGCVLISQHADSEGAPKACEEAGVPNVAYNLDTREWGPNTALVSSKINWQPYFEHIINAVVNGTPITQDYCGSLEDEGVQILGLNEAVAAEGTAATLEEVKQKLIAGEIEVFDTASFTCNGKTLNEYLADVDSDQSFEKETQVIEDGVFQESKFRSAPYFDIIIDGITIK